MRRCPTCNKTYEDALRFCQSDGSQLVDVVQQSPIPTPSAPPAPGVDPFSTAEPASDPLKTIVAGSAPTGAISHPTEPVRVEPSPFSKPDTPTPWAQSAPQSEESTSERVDVSLGSPASESDEPPTVFAAPVVTFGTPETPQQSTIESNWTPPPAPVAGWGDQGLGASTPFQPPVESGEPNKTLAVVSLVCGILGVTCCGVFAGIAAIITGFMARNKAKANPMMYGGSGMAMAGIIMGVFSIIITVVIIILQVVVGVMGNMVK